MSQQRCSRCGADVTTRELPGLGVREVLVDRPRVLHLCTGTPGSSRPGGRLAPASVAQLGEPKGISTPANSDPTVRRPVAKQCRECGYPILLVWDKTRDCYMPVDQATRQPHSCRASDLTRSAVDCPTCGARVNSMFHRASGKRRLFTPDDSTKLHHCIPPEIAVRRSGGGSRLGSADGLQSYQRPSSIDCTCEGSGCASCRR